MIYPGPEGGKPGAQKPVTCITSSIDLGGGHQYLKTDGPTSCSLIVPLRLLHFLYRIGGELYNVTKVSRGINPTWVWAIKIDNSSSFLVKQKMLEGLHITVTVNPIHTFH